MGIIKGDFKASFNNSSSLSIEGKMFKLYLQMKNKIDVAITFIRCLDPFEKELLIIKSKEFQESLKQAKKQQKKLSNPLNAALSITANKAKKRKEYNPDIPFLYGKSLGILGTTHNLRIRIFDIVVSKFFEYFIIGTIIVSSLQLAIDGPLIDPKSSTYAALEWIDFITTIIFAVEAIMKIISVGLLLNGPWSYLRKSYNQLDFIIIILSIVSLSPVSQ